MRVVSRRSGRIFMTNEEIRLVEARDRKRHWKRWGPYLSERAWGTVREDYSSDGNAWDYFPHDHARSRAYRWNEDGIAGICDRHQLFCFALGLWNERDPFLKGTAFRRDRQPGESRRGRKGILLLPRQHSHPLSRSKPSDRLDRPGDQAASTELRLAQTQRGAKLK
jgi:hypothetical protein